ncbi:MAG: DUF480 domain-containing protein [Pseudomonadales bacterium]|nr:DUF480 domain-containing protein [Pseudomonadales bacterium]
MSIQLTTNEVRVLGCLMEKSVITPDQYPLTLNALTNACNQKSSREPVMSLEPGTVKATIRSLQDKHLVRVEENFRTQVEKYTQRLCNTPFSDYQFDPPQFAIVCVLLLRGPRTPGELRANSGRLHTFSDNNAVLAALEELAQREGGPVVAELPVQPGRRDAQWIQLFSGAVPAIARPAAATRVQTREAPPPTAESAARVTELEARIEKLEAEITRLRGLLENDT